MTRRCVTDEQYGQLWRRLEEVARRVDEGAVPFKETMSALQQVIENSQLPTEMTVGGRTYDILGFLKGDEEYVKGDVMVARAKEKDANLGEEDARHILEHQDEIPAVLRGKVVFVFPDWRHPDYSEGVFCVYWDDDRWVGGWRWLDGDWDVGSRLLRRK